MKKVVTKEQIDEFVRRRNNGEEFRDIANDYGYSYQVVRYWYNKVTNKEKPKPKDICSNCVYGGHLEGQYKGCEYILRTGKPRPCGVENCSVYEPLTEKRKPTIQTFSGKRFEKEDYERLMYSTEIIN